MSLYYQYEQMSTRLKSYAIATVFVFLVSFIGSNKQFFNVESVFKFLNHEFNPIQDGHFWDCFQMGEGGGEGAKRPPSLKSVTHILQSYNWAVIPYLRKIQKIYEHITHPLTYADTSSFSPEISKFCYIKKDRYRLDFDT